MQENNKSANEKKQYKYEKKRNWACVVYPESAPNNWVDILKQTGLAIAISPLHDKDLNGEEEEKKPHWHVILCFEGPQTANSVQTITKSINATIPIAISSVRGYYRYFTHKDNPEKYQYDERDITHLNGFNVLDFVELTKSEIDKIKYKLVEEIIKNKLHEYADFVLHVMYNCTDEEFNVATSHTIFFNTFITSFRHSSGFPSGEGT